MAKVAFSTVCVEGDYQSCDMPGVTRDLISAEVDNDYMLLDTGGIGMEFEMTPSRFWMPQKIKSILPRQAVDVILLLVDVRSGITALDEMVAENLRRYGKTILLVANKVDSETEEHLSHDFSRLGLGSAINISAEHGRGIVFLKNKLEEALGPKPEATNPSISNKRVLTVSRSTKRRQVFNW